MTRSRSSRGRHRGRRVRPAEAVPPEGVAEGQAPEGGIPEDGHRPVTAEQRAVQQPSQPGQRTGTTVQQRGASRDSGRSSGPARLQNQRGIGGPQQGAGGPGRNPRRRQPRRQPILEVSGEIIKQRALDSAVPGTMIKRSLEDVDGPDGPILGCPMLTRTRLSLPVSGNHPAPRCSLGWGIHAEEEAMYCMMTPDLTLCWKANPDRLDALRAILEERETAAD